MRDRKIGGALESSGEWPGFFKALGRGDADDDGSHGVSSSIRDGE